MGGGKCPSPSCSATFASGKAKRRHVFRESHGHYVQCSICKEPFLSEVALKRHMGSIDHSRVKVSRRRRKRGKSSKKGMYTVGSRTQLNSFLAENIQPQASFLDSNSSAVNKIVHFLQNNSPQELRIARVVKGGSLGKGTAVKENSDIDVTVVLGGIDDIETLMRRLPEILSKLETHLPSLPGARVTGTTKHAVQVDLDGHSVDILPAMDIDIFNDSSLQQLYEAMRLRESDNRFFSSTLSPLQLEIIRPLPTKVKSLIRLIKYWKTNKLQIPKVPVSYVMELVVINAWQKNGSPVDFDMLGALKSVLTNLDKHQAFMVEFASLRKYPAGMAKVTSGPYIIDPTNPFNDVYHGLFETAWNWEGVAREARRWLGMPLFN